MVSQITPRPQSGMQCQDRRQTSTRAIQRIGSLLSPFTCPPPQIDTCAKWCRVTSSMSRRQAVSNPPHPRLGRLQTHHGAPQATRALPIAPAHSFLLRLPAQRRGAWLRPREISRDWEVGRRGGASGTSSGQWVGRVERCVYIGRMSARPARPGRAAARGATTEQSAAAAGG